MVRKVSSDYDLLLGLAYRVPVAPDHLCRGVNSIRTVAGKEDPTVWYRRKLRDALAELFGRLVGVESEGRVGRQLSHLASGGFGYVLPTVADVAVPEAGGGVQVASAVPV